MQSDPIGLAAGANTYNYVGMNPLNAIDPLGLLERDKFGNLVFYNPQPTTPFEVPNSNIKVAAIKGFLKTDEGHYIRAYKRIGENPPGLDYTADCHGWSFADGQYWINNEEVATILADEYSFVTGGASDLQAGDKLIYTENGMVKHSLTVAKTSQGFLGYGKGGNEFQPYLQPYRTAWKSETGADVKITIYRKIKK